MRKNAFKTEQGISWRYITPSGAKLSDNDVFLNARDMYNFSDEIDACGWNAQEMLNVCRDYRVGNCFSVPAYEILRDTPQSIHILLDKDGSIMEFDRGHIAGIRRVAQERAVDSETWWGWFDDACDDIDGLVGHFFGKPVELFGDTDNYGTYETRVDVKVNASTNSMSEMDLEDLRDVLHAAVRAIEYAKDLSGWTIID